MTVLAIEWDDTGGREGRGAVRLLDQTLLPGTTAYRVVDRTDDLVGAIAELAVRGAPALGGSLLPTQRDFSGEPRIVMQLLPRLPV